MSRSRKRYPAYVQWHPYRNPRGRRWAKINNVRKGAIPPDARDDLPLCNINWLPYRVVHNMCEGGFTREEAIHKLMKKFKMSHEAAMYLVKGTYPDEEGDA